MSLSRSLAAVVLATAVFAAIADEPPADRYELQDGATLYVHPDGTTRMVDPHGKPMAMSDDVPMRLQDGRTIMMKNKYVWVKFGPPGQPTTARIKE